MAADFGLSNNWLTDTVEYYDKSTKNLLVSRQLNASIGYSIQPDNIGEIQKKGIELQLICYEMHGGYMIEDNNWGGCSFAWTTPNNYLKSLYSPDPATFIDALENYRSTISTAFFKDFGDRKFAVRAYLNDKVKFGLDVVCLEPQGYLLQIPDLSIARKKEIYEYVKGKNFTPEQIGFRIREKPLWSKNGEGEDGAIWYSLEYPVLLGVAMFDKAEARSLLKAFSFEKSGAKYPNYWMGQWTAADDINSSLSIHDGLYSFWDGGGMKSYFHGYCSHPHTWPLFCYFKLKE